MFRPSSHATRGFCAEWGTPLSFSSEQFPDHADVTHATLDDPNVVAPRAHIWTRSKVAWVHLRDDLARKERGLTDP